MASKELIEKVARDLCSSDGQDPDDYASRCDICGPDNEPLPKWHIYTEQAETACSTILAALQEPNAEMINALWSVNSSRGWPEAAKTCWQSAINASPLGEQSE